VVLDSCRGDQEAAEAYIDHNAHRRAIVDLLVRCVAGWACERSRKGSGALVAPGCENRNRANRAEQASFGSDGQRRRGISIHFLATAVGRGSDRRSSFLCTGHRSSSLAAGQGSDLLLAGHDIDRAGPALNETGMKV